MFSIQQVIFHHHRMTKTMEKKGILMINKHNNISIRADTAAKLCDGKIITRIGNIDTKEAGDNGSRTIDISFASEQPYERWFGNEILGCDPQNVNTKRFDNGLGTVLYNHNRDSVVGHVERAYIDEKTHKCRAEVRFDTDDLSDWVWTKIQSGTLQGVSVGYQVNQYTALEDEKTVSSNGRWTGPAYVATKWTPMEISIVSVPADDDVGVNRSVPDIDPENTKETKKMTENEILEAIRGITDESQRNTLLENINRSFPAAQAPAGLISPNVPQLEEKKLTDEDVKQSAVEERTRIRSIMDLCRQFDVPSDEYISSGATLDSVRAAVLEKMAKRQPPIATVVEEEQDKFRAAAQDALYLRAGITVAKPAAGATDLRGMRLIDLARECLIREGKASEINYSDPMGLVRDAITGTAAYTNILANVAHKTMNTAYQAAPTTYQLWTRSGSNTDFKAATRVQLSEADLLKEIPENGQYQHAELIDSGISIKLRTFGRKFSLTRQAIINDDLGALTMIPQKFGQAARRGINNDVYSLLIANKMQDGTTDLFSADHTNLTSTGTALSVASLGAASAMMARQKNIRGKEVLNIRPQYLIVPPELFVAASQLVSSNVDPSRNNATPNPFFNALSVVPDACLTDVLAWYLAGNPGITDTIEVTYLNGNENPYMEQRIGFDVDGVEFKIRHDYQATVLDYKALYKNAGK
jgi:phage head maturation protease